MKIAFAVLASFALALGLRAEPMTFDFKDPAGTNQVAFKLAAPLEVINGTACGVSGQITTDPKNFTATKGKIIVDANTLAVPTPAMQQDLQDENWVAIRKSSEISFEFKDISHLAQDGPSGSADVTGIFTLKGISKEMTVPVKITYLPGKLSEKTQGKMEGDVLVIRSSFSIKRSDYDIQPGENLENVADKIEISFSIAGAAPKPPLATVDGTP